MNTQEANDRAVELRHLIEQADICRFQKLQCECLRVGVPDDLQAALKDATERIAELRAAS